MTKMEPHTSFPGRLSRRAFSLVEIILALGITVFVLTILISLLALGVQTAAESRSDSLVVFMADSLRSELVTNPDWPGAIPVGTPFYLYFTEDGSLTRGGAFIGAFSPEALYVAEIRRWEGSDNGLLATDGNSRRYRYWDSDRLQNLHIRFFPTRGREITAANPPREINLLTQFTLARAMP